MTTLHFAAGGGLNAQGTYAPAAAGFNLADVSSVDELNALPAGVQGLVWLNNANGVDQSFINEVQQYAGNSKLYGFYLADEPDPTGQWGTQISASTFMAESDYIHSHLPGAKTFITMMNMGSNENPSYANSYNPANTHIDLFGIDPYPVQSTGTIDYSIIDKAVAAAEAEGIPQSAIVPVFQTFGGGNWSTESGGSYVMPTAAQEQAMLGHWAAVVPNPAFDMAYSWASQNGDTALESSPALQAVFQQHNTSTSMTLPTGSTGGSTTGSTDTSGGSTTPGGTTTGSSSGSTTTTDTGGHHHHHGLDYAALTGASTTSPTIDVSTSTATTPVVTDPTGTTSGTGWSGGGYHWADAMGGSTTDHHWHW
ncbi:calcium-binding protein [Bradyrhizobium erythrophlei]|uniref:calcium-binding protein n=1 Tax=Bradyrhizobium erythrophlei TaxID=1437360 RepID=UPI0035EC123E